MALVVVCSAWEASEAAPDGEDLSRSTICEPSEAVDLEELIRFAELASTRSGVGGAM